MREGGKEVREVALNSFGVIRALYDDRFRSYEQRRKRGGGGIYGRRWFVNTIGGQRVRKIFFLRIDDDDDDRPTTLCAKTCFRVDVPYYTTPFSRIRAAQC